MRTEGAEPSSPGGLAGFARLHGSLRPLTHFASASIATRTEFADDPAHEGEAAKSDTKRTRKMEEARLFDVASSHSRSSIIPI